jgi:hypothetical protein
MVQGGDFERMDGTGGQSVYGAKVCLGLSAMRVLAHFQFDDENFTKRHDSESSA